MRRLKNQAGNTLIISVILLVLFSVIGLSIMTLTMNGISKNEVRENNIRAAAYAEKGIDRITQQINLELETVLKNTNYSGLPRENFIKILNSTLDHYTCSNNMITEKDKYSVCIKKISPTYEIYDETIENKTRKLIKFESTGYSGGVEKVLSSKIEMGAEIAPPSLNYAVGSNQDKNKNGGDLTLNGGLSIQGDIKVDNVLTTSYLLGDLPKIYPSSGKQKSIINIGSENTNQRPPLFSNDSLYKITKFIPEYSNLGIKDYVENFNNSNDIYSTREYDRNNLTYVKINDLTEDLGNIKPVSKECYWLFWLRCENKENPNVPFRITGVNTIKKFTTPADLHIFDANLTIKDGLYVGGNLSISGDVTIEGPIYVNGKVNINGNIDSNSMIYSLQDVNIQLSKLNPKGEKGSLIILTKENIKINFNSVIQNRINAFFYAENDIKITGIFSNMEIKGGVSGKNVILTGIDFFNKSRLQIIYDKDIIDIYNNLKRKQHVIYKIEPPIVKDREV
ncbi:hypothetical protein [Psychrobacillus sp. BL-248-WT-3]|uniref:pilus assembly PilX N-terminal domain-containing protein n=1 Tax=Psychrobacillus sp. BL-248-WT-3 TaxID=2725306 RepID=UPI00146CBE70|nr:hypothetical protein [Psychrobacillus sp. BL-248-WT-3]NME06159.1 hypothetical protein [Psychrobacillus sp. BL-248-WT-3]